MIIIENNSDIAILEEHDKNISKTVSQLKDSFRTLEDIFFADRLEILENKETISEIKELATTAKEKLSLLENAVKMLGEKKKSAEENELPELYNKINSLAAGMDNIKKVMNNLNAKSSSQATSIENNEINRIKTDFGALKNNFNRLIDIIKGNFNEHTAQIESLDEKMEGIKKLNEEAERRITELKTFSVTPKTKRTKKIIEELEKQKAYDKEMLEKLESIVKKNQEKIENLEETGSLSRDSLDRLKKETDSAKELGLKVEKNMEEIRNIIKVNDLDALLTKLNQFRGIEQIDSDIKKAIEDELKTVKNVMNEIELNFERRIQSTKIENNERVNELRLELLKNVKQLGSLNVTLKEELDKIRQIKTEGRLSEKDKEAILKLEQTIEELKEKNNRIIETEAMEVQKNSRENEKLQKEHPSETEELPKGRKEMVEKIREMEKHLEERQIHVNREAYSRIREIIKPLKTNVENLTDEIEAIKEGMKDEIEERTVEELKPEIRGVIKDQMALFIENILKPLQNENTLLREEIKELKQIYMKLNKIQSQQPIIIE